MPNQSSILYAFTDIDADIRFNAADVLPMLEADKDIICGIYPKKEINWHGVKNALDAGVDVDSLKHHTGSFVVNLVGYSGSATVPINEPVEIWTGGTAFMIIKREVFEKLADLVPAYTNDVNDLAGNLKAEEIKEYFATSIEPGTNRLLSEDYHFCELWKKEGRKIYADPTIELRHLGQHVYAGDLMRAGRNNT